ncbi:hypothetical protein IJS77_00530 [bacterium]|nr:hypothetical protein [bacterium]
MIILLLLLILIAVLGFGTYQYYKITVDEILNKLIILDGIFEARYNDLSKAIAQFQKYMPEQKDLIFDIQRAKADAAKVSKPKSTKELADKILNENALTVNLNFLLDKCNFKTINPELKEHVSKQVDYIQQISKTADEYNKLIINYKKIKDVFPFKQYAKFKGIELDLDIIKTE